MKHLAVHPMVEYAVEINGVLTFQCGCIVKKSKDTTGDYVGCWFRSACDKHKDEPFTIRAEA